MRHRLSMAAALLLFVAAAMANGLFVGLAHDEGVTVDIAVGRLDPNPHGAVPITKMYSRIDGEHPRSVGQVIAELTGPFKNPSPPAYYVLMRGWTELFGVHRVTLRIPSLFFGVLSLLGLACLGRRLVPRPGIEIWIVILAALSPWFVSIMTFARPYALTMAVAVWATVAALAVADDKARLRSRTVFILLSLLGLYTLYHYAFVLAWQLVFLAAIALRAGPERRVRELLGLLFLAATITAGFLPWLPILLEHLRLTGTVPSYFHGSLAEDASSGLINLLRTFSLGDAIGGFAGQLLAWTLGLLTLVTLALLLTLRRAGVRSQEDMPTAIMVRTAPLYPVMILVADMLHGTRTLTLTKMSLLLYPFLLLLVLRAWLSLSMPRVRRLGLALWVVLLLAAMGTTIYSRSRWIDHHQAVANSLAASDDDHHMVILNSMIRGHATPLLLTLREHGVHNVHIVLAPPSRLTSVLDDVCQLTDYRVTLVNMHTVYTWAPSELMWTPEQLRSAARQARQAGWEVRRFEPKDLLDREQPAPGARRFEIIATVW